MEVLEIQNKFYIKHLPPARDIISLEILLETRRCTTVRDSEGQLIAYISGRVVNGLVNNG